MLTVVIFGTASTGAFAAISAASAFFSFFANCNCRHKSKRKNCANNNIPNIHNAPLPLHTYQGADRIDYKRCHPCNQALPSNKKYREEKLESITFRVPKGNKARIQAHAAANGESTNAFIYRAINETIDREKQPDME